MNIFESHYIMQSGLEINGFVFVFQGSFRHQASG